MIQVPVACDGDTQELRNELASTKKALANELARMQKLQNKCNTYKEELDSLKQLRQKQEEEEEDRGDAEKSRKHLERQRSALLLVVKKQMKLIDVLKQERSHAEAAVLLSITEKDFMNEMNS